MDLELGIDTTYGRSKASYHARGNPTMELEPAFPMLGVLWLRALSGGPWASDSNVDKTLQTLQCSNANPSKP